jgi:type I restriction enzyme S subunit
LGELIGPWDEVMDATMRKPATKELRRFRPYPAYKDSGIEWLGEIPAHWEVKRLKTVASAQLSNVDKKSLQGQEPVSLCNYVDVYYNERITPNPDFMRATATPEQIRRFTLRAGDVLITKDSESWMDIAVPAVVEEDLPGVLCGYHLAHIRPGPGCVGSFLSRAFSAIGPRDQFQIAANGITRFGLGNDAMQTGQFTIPPESEQRAIAVFLDRETARIDKLLAKKERLIELLQEKRTALINRAVTKGLDPSVPMKDSGVEWLGEIPAHWEVKRIKWAAKMESGHTPDKKVAAYWQGGDIPWISLADTKQLREVDYIADTAAMTTSDGIANSSAHILPAGTVVFSRDATIGLCAITRAGIAVSQHFIGWVCGTHLRPEYLLFVFRSMTWELERLTMGATVRTIGMPDVRSLVTPIPPVPEQVSIVDHILKNRSQIDALVAKVRDAIDRLKEFRLALISAAVTGKIDVRGEVA